MVEGPGDALARARTLLSAASTVGTVSLRVLYVAEARTILDAEAERLAAARGLLDAQETELARLARLTA